MELGARPSNGSRRQASGRRRVRRDSALLQPQRTALSTPSASRLDPLAPDRRRDVAHYSDRLLEEARRGFRVLLVNPAPEEIVQGGWYRMPLLGLGYLAAYLREKGFSVGIVDAKFDRLGLDAVLARIKAFSPALLGVTAMTHEVRRAAEIAAAAKRLLPDLKTVIGGPHATAIPVETLDEFPSFDFVIAGEGEETLLELSDSLALGKGFAGIAGVSFRGHGGAAGSNPPRPWRQGS